MRSGLRTAILDLDLRGGHIDVHVCRNSLNCTLKMPAIDCHIAMRFLLIGGDEMSQPHCSTSQVSKLRLQGHSTVRRVSGFKPKSVGHTGAHVLSRLPQTLLQALLTRKEDDLWSTRSGLKQDYFSTLPVNTNAQGQGNTFLVFFFHPRIQEYSHAPIHASTHARIIIHSLIHPSISHKFFGEWWLKCRFWSRNWLKFESRLCH